MTEIPSGVSQTQHLPAVTQPHVHSESGMLHHPLDPWGTRETDTDMKLRPSALISLVNCLHLFGFSVSLVAKPREVWQASLTAAITSRTI